MQFDNNMKSLEQYYLAGFQQCTMWLSSWLLISGHAICVKLCKDICACPVTAVF